MMEIHGGFPLGRSHLRADGIGYIYLHLLYVTSNVRHQISCVSLSLYIIHVYTHIHIHIYMCRYICIVVISLHAKNWAAECLQEPTSTHIAIPKRCHTSPPAPCHTLGEPGERRPICTPSGRWMRTTRRILSCRPISSKWRRARDGRLVAPESPWL